MTHYEYDPKEIGRDGTFVAYDNGVVYDTRTDLEWFAGPDKSTNWKKAKSWIENLDAAGGGWRMPTSHELKTLFRKGAGESNMTPLLNTRGCYVWAGDGDIAKGSFWSRWEKSCFDFNFDGYESQELWWFSSRYRAFAVRVRYAEFLAAAAYQGDLEAVRTLLRKRAKIDARNAKGYTALMTAAMNGHDEVVKLLIDWGSDIHAKQKDGKTALSYALEGGHGKIADLLRGYGAKEMAL
ncbi:ankyrin repeat domain-containing protein [Thermodesulfobacteriota bacterium]